LRAIAAAVKGGEALEWSPTSVNALIALTNYFDNAKASVVNRPIARSLE
jgi:hypothetical protein